MERAQGGMGGHAHPLRAPSPVANSCAVPHWSCAALRCLLVAQLGQPENAFGRP